MKKVALIVLDSLGVGALPDAEKYGDSGSNTLGHIIESMPDIAIPNLRDLGFMNIQGLEEYKMAVKHPKAAYGRLAELSNGKDTITGHWELMGIRTVQPFKTYEKFPESFMKSYEEAIGLETLGNYAASGTEIIKELGPEHEATGKPIIYTSADSVFQVAANTDVIPLERLYEICEIAREMLIGDLAVGRVIARPYIKEGEERIRTSDRKDYSVAPPQNTVMDNLLASNKEVVAIGKIRDIFNGRGISQSVHTENNEDGCDKIMDFLKKDFEGFIFANLVDFDSKYGHRRNPVGYGKAIEEFDAILPHILELLGKDDLLILCADHGNDPVHEGWDHTREYVPLIVYGHSVKTKKLGTRESFADVGSSIAEFFGIKATDIGKSFIGEIL